MNICICIHRPSAVRFPRGNGYGVDTIRDLFGTQFSNNELPARGTPLEIGKGRVVKSRTQGKKYRVSLLSIGTRLHDSVLAARAIEETYPDVSVVVADARFMKPLDEEMISQLATESNVLITVEEGSVGGFGSHVQQFLCDNGHLDHVSTYLYIYTVCIHMYLSFIFIYDTARIQLPSFSFDIYQLEFEMQSTCNNYLYIYIYIYICMYFAPTCRVHCV